MNDQERTRPSAATRATEEEDARVEAHSDRTATTGEEDAAARAGRVDESAARSYKEAIERGADQEGEGRIP